MVDQLAHNQNEVGSIPTPATNLEVDRFAGLNLEKEEAQYSRALLEERLDFLCRYYLEFKDWDYCHSELNEWLMQSTKKRKLILMPRGHLKTSIVTVGLTIQHILKDPNTTILLANAVWDNARSFLSEIKEYLTTKSKLYYLYGKYESYRWNQDEIMVKQRKKANKTPTVSTAGIDKALASQHYKVIICDDIVNRQTISTEEQRDKVKKFYSDLLDLLEPDGTLYLVGTRWHDADLYGDIIRHEAEKFDIYKRSAIENEQVIFPKKFSLETLADLKQSKGSYEFACQYMNDPMPSEDQHFKLPVRYWTDLGDSSRHTISVDLAISEKTSADYTVVMDCAVTASNQLCVVEYCRRRMSPLDTIERIFEMVLKYKVKKVGIESVAYQRALISILDEEIKKRGIFFEVVPIHPSKDKFTRTIALQPRWESGNLLLKQGMVELEEELARFPVGEHDDLLDALSMQLNIIQPTAKRSKVWIPSKYREQNYGYQY